MPRWAQRIDIASVIETWDEDAWDDDVPRVATDVADALAANCKFGRVVAELRECETVEDFNYLLQDAYNIADLERVWLGKSHQR